MNGVLQLELISALVRHGAEAEPEELVDPSSDAELRSAGVAVVTAYIERLALAGLVRDAEPMFGVDGGMWIGFRLTEEGRQLAGSEPDLRRAIADLTGGPRTEVSEAVASLRSECEHAGINELYREDFLRTLDEIGICFDSGCFIAAIALSGKILEVCLKEILVRADTEYDPNSGIGRLLKLIRENSDEYVDPALGDIANVINKSRNVAVHANEHVPVPSRDQAASVIFAMRDVVRRNLTHQD